MSCRLRQLLKLKREHSFMQIFHFFAHICYEYRWSRHESYENSSHRSSTAKWGKGTEIYQVKSHCFICKVLANFRV